MKAQVVSFHCILRDKLGQIISSSFNSEVVNQLEPGGDSVLRGLVAGIQDVKEGEKREIFVSADQAYGLYDPELVVKMLRRDLAQGLSLKIGSEIKTQSMADGRTVIYRVIDVEKDYVVLDGNHPLAGQDLFFEVEITAVRDALEDDLVLPRPRNQKNQLH